MRSHTGNFLNSNIDQNNNSNNIKLNDNKNHCHSALLQMTDHITYSSFMTLESTEIDYLRQIIYAYMMGTDPVVSIFAVFKY